MSIYMGTSPSGKRYIGQARSDARHKGDGIARFKQHAWESEKTAIHDAIKFYGIENFKVEILVRAPNDELNSLEVKLIEAYGTYGKWGYNQTRGGEINPMHDVSVKEKCVATHRRPEIKAKHKASMRATMGSDAMRQKISVSMKAKLQTPIAKAQRKHQLASCDQKKRADAAAAALKKPEIKRKHLAALIKNSKNPDNLKKRSESMKQHYANDPSAKQRRSDAMKA